MPVDKIVLQTARVREWCQFDSKLGNRRGTEWGTEWETEGETAWETEWATAWETVPLGAINNQK